MAERFACLSSGRGTTMEYVASAIRDGRIRNVVMGGVIASNHHAGVIEKARNLDIPVEVIDPNDFRGTDGKVHRPAYAARLFDVSRNLFGATFFTQYGHTEYTPEEYILKMEEYGIGGINEHPGPLPETKGLLGLQPAAAMLRFTKLTGINNGMEVVAHKVVKKLDAGPLYGVSKVPINFPYDYPKRLQERGLPVEHELQVVVLNKVGNGTLKEIPQEAHYMKEGQSEILSESVLYAKKKFPKG